MLPFEEALGHVLGRARALETESVPIDQALGRVLAEPLAARAPLPPFDYSAMDGYALDSSRLPDRGPWQLRVSAESRTGHPAGPLEPDTACRIFTGAAIPGGADAVIMQERTERRGDTLTLLERPAAGAHIRRAGEDLSSGAVALEAGTRLGPYQLGLVAALDRATLPVARQPRVEILCTGDELRAPGSPPRPGSIPESNSVVLRALAERAGAVVRVARPENDDRAMIEQAIFGALERADLLVTVGGVSVGDYDVVRPALEAAGATVDFWKVAIKPGKPLVLGHAEHAVVLGLPGNPVSAQLTFALFGLPLIRAMQRDRHPTPTATRRVLAEAITQSPGRRGFYRGRLDGDRVYPLAGQSSGATTSLARADALIVVSETAEGAAAGETVDVLALAEL